MPLLLSGNEAIVEGALASKCRFFGGYPITPSSDIAELMSLRLPTLGGKFIQMEDEIASLGACLGASLTGIKSMTATSGPGLSLMQEHIGFAAMGEIPCVIVDVQRGGPSTGLPTYPSQGDAMQSRWGTHGDHPIIVLTPFSVRECYSLTIRAFNYSEKYRTPVILLSDEILAHLREKVELDTSIEVLERGFPNVPPQEYLPFDSRYDVPPLAPYGRGYRFHITGLAHDETGFPTSNPEKVQKLQQRLATKIKEADVRDLDVRFMDDAKICIFSYGSTSRSSLRVVNEIRKKGERIGFVRPITLWPFPYGEVKKLSKKVDMIYVCEMNLGQIVREVERASECDVRFIGKADGTIITPEEILHNISM
ncbi:MAG: 2-oxoacid:acceptor oxidoreductase subunit alpha [candidate division WOR-3 bacterium]|nr:2-oxoacid:acceptor oxidoreductase subunit alpha [candidate division WOR-3 bacterium]